MNYKKNYINMNGGGSSYQNQNDTKHLSNNPPNSALENTSFFTMKNILLIGIIIGIGIIVIIFYAIYENYESYKKKEKKNK